jgi:hypothetical protein
VTLVTLHSSLGVIVRMWSPFLEIRCAFTTFSTMCSIDESFITSRAFSTSVYSIVAFKMIWADWTGLASGTKEVFRALVAVQRNNHGWIIAGIVRVVLIAIKRVTIVVTVAVG